MKNLLLSVIFLGIAAYVGVELYERGKDYDWTGAPASSKDDQSAPTEHKNTGPAKSFPVDMKIESTDGRTIQVTILSQNSSHIKFRRSSDSQIFVYPLTQLTKETRNALKAYPATGLSADNSSKSLEDVYVEQLQEEIAKIDETLARMKQKFVGTQSNTDKRTLQRDAEDLMKERSELERKIAERSQ